MSSEVSLEGRERPGFVRRAVSGCAKAAFSQIGLVILVVIYVLLGAVLFEYLESGPEVQKRSAIQRSREECLKELWAITGQLLSSLRMTDIKELKKKRGSCKGRLTAFGNYLSIFDSAEPTECQVMELQLRLDKLDSLYDEFNDLQIQLECLTENLEAETLERTTVESQYYSLMAKGKTLINKHSNPDQDNRSNHSGSMKHNSTRHSNSNATFKRQLVKLPTINLPKFAGSYDNWLEFRDTFSSLIHDNDDIDKINKFHYLRSSLEGSAAVVIQSIEFSSKNYNLAWDLLCERFDNKRLLIQNHVSALFNLEPITKESSSSLKRIIDQVNKNIRALGTLGEPIHNWDTLLIHIISNKLDSKTYREWEERKGHFDKTKTISFVTFVDFLRSRADLIETLELSRHSNSTYHPNTSVNKHSNTKLKTMLSLDRSNSLSGSSSCPKCNGDHNLNVCPQFLSLNLNERMTALTSYRVCFNCFRRGHYPNQCKKSGCRICKHKHHTLIHNPDYKSNKSYTNNTNNNSARTDLLSQTAGDAVTENKNHVALSANVSAHPDTCNSGDILLSTALIKCYDIYNKEHIVRALLDSGSSSCLITQELFTKLNLTPVNTDMTIQGINNSISTIEKMCRVHIKSLCESYSNNLICFVLPIITDNIPSRQIHINIPSDIQLADPYFHTPGSIDMIIGADVFWDLLDSGRIALGDKKPTLHQTKLGWLVCGPINGGHSVPQQPSPIKCNYSIVHTQGSSQIQVFDGIETQLTRFWQLEEVCRESSTYSAEEMLCEEHFIKNTTRLHDGRFCVKIPLKESPEVLGNSFNRAQSYFLSLERRNKKQPRFDIMYKNFMSEYIAYGHMTECHSIDEDKISYFIPHHGVMRESSSTTKLRVVFNASAPTTSGVSFNQIQIVGPNVQDDLTAILLRFRMYKYVLSADVEKMYRQILVHESDRHLQRIIWRSDTSCPIKVYNLNTVTYGTASAPFLATRCLKQIGLECDDQELAEVITHDFYVDDLLTGADNLKDIHKLRRGVVNALASASMHLRKWKSNEPSLLSEQPNQTPFDLNMEGDALNKTLGLTWDQQSDQLCFPILVPENIENTKREMLGTIARIFDPLGLVTPCVVRMKILLQRLWLEKLSWDEPLSTEISTTWAKLITLLPALNTLRIPRLVVCDSYIGLEFHIFTDASESAYGACLYVRSVNVHGKVEVHLLTAKSRVAPIKPLTVPRLELCAAVVGARLYQRVASSLRTQTSSVHFWTDSMIVLGWLKMLPIKLNTFVRNRVAEIVDETSPHTWRHVQTDQNPADLLSRGVEPTSIQSSDLWWIGPKFLKQDSASWPCTPESCRILPEIKTSTCLHVNQNDSTSFIDFKRFSNFLRLQHTIGYVVRFINLCRKRVVEPSHFTVDELKHSLNILIIQSQRESFPEYNLLQENKKLPHKNRLLKLNIFLDENRIMRVGGRLSNSNYSFDKKHPILIQSTHHFVKLLFRYEHLQLMHASPQLLLANIHDTYWPLGGRNLARACYRRCIRCLRLKGHTITPQMGHLPSSRFSPADYPFQNVGVDYAGPITSVSRQGRGCKLLKVYIVIFVCFTTKAIHLELVGDLTSNNYLQALRRFMSRRGKPLNIYSDNGTSFVGAYNDLSKFLQSSCNSITESVAHDGIKFHFIPAYAPHFGGLWEAGVRSTKYHLVRVLGNCHLTYEELNSTLVQIEGILNSRPLTPLTSNVEDFLPLTPGHFLIGRPLTSLPARDLRTHSSHHLTRLQRIEQLRQHFWERWSKEYITELQQRAKWQENKDSLKLNSLVVIKEDNLPPLKWKLGRVVALYPGKDHICRVADIKTANGVIRRDFARICPLIEDC